MLYVLEQVARRYDERVVLDIDRLEIQSGRIYALLGPNGAGKTTLLHILGFLEAPTTGRITFRGKPAGSSQAALMQLRRQVVLVDQHPIMFTTTVCRNIEFGLKIRGMDKKARLRIVDRVLETVGLRQFKQARAYELSGGETQRLALARALALAPSVLLCDEPTASVDAENQAVIGTLLQSINTTHGTTILFTTHDRLQAAALAQETLVLESGRLAATTYENSYAYNTLPGPDGRFRCMLHGRVELPCSLPAGFLEKNSRLYIAPEKITLSRLPGGGAAQEVSGAVLLIMAEGELVRVVVNIGVLMVVLMDRAGYRNEHPVIGETVHLQFGSDAVTALEQPP